ncbi:hypothetical protein QVD17_05359 [Tagetes erecta]|uniref:Uncharacterized protein n=1 Tax=Tagetes erecta TaxID=13708 RepID=A0AAD8LEV9_TARER|nr:hypothetical protein QVD17_05359 [Tagetes erecta]
MSKTEQQDFPGPSSIQSCPEDEGGCGGGSDGGGYGYGDGDGDGDGDEDEDFFRVIYVFDPIRLSSVPLNFQFQFQFVIVSNDCT